MLLAAVARADGVLADNEIDAIARAALDEGLELEEVEALEAAIRDGVAIDDIDVHKLAPEDRLYVYAVASWIALVDGERVEREEAALISLAYVLRLTPRGKSEADALVQHLYAQNEGETLARYDLATLRRELDQRMKRSMMPPSSV